MVEGEPFTKMEKKTVEIRFPIHLTQSYLKPYARKTSFRKLQFTLSYALAKSTLRSIPEVLVCFKECIISWVRIIPSRIWRPSTKHVCSGEIRLGSRGFNLLGITFVMVLRITLQRDIGWNLPQESAPCSFGIRVRKVELKALRTLPVLQDSSTISQTSSFTKSQHC